MDCPSSDVLWNYIRYITIIIGECVFYCLYVCNLNVSRRWSHQITDWKRATPTYPAKKHHSTYHQNPTWNNDEMLFSLFREVIGGITHLVHRCGKFNLKNNIGSTKAERALPHRQKDEAFHIVSPIRLKSRGHCYDSFTLAKKVHMKRYLL